MWLYPDWGGVVQPSCTDDPSDYIYFGYDTTSTSECLYYKFEYSGSTPDQSFAYTVDCTGTSSSYTWKVTEWYCKDSRCVWSSHDLLFSIV